MKIPQKSPNACEEEEAIFSYLDLKKQHHDILLRARDLEKLVHGAKYEIVNLRQMAEVLNTSQLEDIFKTVESNTKTLADSSIVVKKSGSSLELVQLLLAGSFAFTLLDRIPGGSLNIEVPEWVNTVFTKGIIDVPFLFFILNMVWMCVCVAIVFKYKQRKFYKEEFGRHTLRVKVNKAINIFSFEAFLTTKMLEKQESVSQPASELRRVMWRDLSGSSSSSPDHPSGGIQSPKKGSKKGRLSWKLRLKQMLCYSWWRAAGKSRATTPMGNSVSPNFAGSGSTTALEDGIPVEIEVEYDSRHGYLLFVTFQFHTRDRKYPSVFRKALFSAIAWLRALADPKPVAAKKQHQQQPQQADHQVGNELAASIDLTAKMEEELMNWFASELKQHQVIETVDVFLGIITAK